MSDALSAACPGATFSISLSGATGTISFKSDNTMTSSAVISIQETIQLPSTCASEAQCTDFESQISNTAGVTNSQCSYAAATGCTCSVTSTQASMSDGTYQVQGSNVTVTTSGSDTSAVDSFCVSGNTLSLYESDANGTGLIVLTK